MDSKFIYQELYSLMGNDPNTGQRRTIIPDIPKSMIEKIDIKPFEEMYKNVRWRLNKS